jgi:hypothetical protein
MKPWITRGWLGTRRNPQTGFEPLRLARAVPGADPPHREASDPHAVEERKRKKPSTPEGVPVWSHDGIVCVCDFLKESVRLTFPKGASLGDPRGLFNARLESRSVRAIDIHRGESINEGALGEWIRAAVALNSSRSKAAR